MKTNKIFISAFALTIAFASLTSCSSDSDSSLPPIGGYNNAGEVGATDLVAYWPLNGNGKESISNTSPSATVGASYNTAVKGDGLVLTNGYLAYPEITALASTSASMSISLWAKITNNGGTDGHPTMLFSLTRPNEWAGNLNLMSETGWRTSASDTLVVKGLAVIKNGDGSANFQDIINSANPSPDDIAAGHVAHAAKYANAWAHYVITWDAPTALFKVYANGQKISNPVWESRNGGTALPLNFFTPAKAVIGTFGTVVSGTADSWQRPMNGQIDEIRVWKKALSASDINSLYELELAGR
ncbi:LamG-like jellyroll fold domain-containing protein [Flavobacterium sp.]|uniref:LamG-like jellyroll fold domain-containing protein n=1 Tax=Flavobacterium sp. TaxID=239 RepID=UPI00391B4CC2